MIMLLFEHFTFILILYFAKQGKFVFFYDNTKTNFCAFAFFFKDICLHTQDTSLLLYSGRQHNPGMTMELTACNCSALQAPVHLK